MAKNKITFFFKHFYNDKFFKNLKTYDCIILNIIHIYIL